MTDYTVTLEIIRKYPQLKRGELSAPSWKDTMIVKCSKCNTASTVKFDSDDSGMKVVLPCDCATEKETKKILREIEKLKGICMAT